LPPPTDPPWTRKRPRTRGAGPFSSLDEIPRQTHQDPLDIAVRCCDNHDMTTTQDSSRYEDLATTTWWLDTIGRGVWEEATLEAEGIDPADDDEWEQWEQVRWIGR